MHLEPYMKKEKTYSVLFAGRKDGLLVRVGVDLAKVTGATWRATPCDEHQVLILDKPKHRTLYVPYHSIRYVEQSKLSEAEALFG